MTEDSAADAEPTDLPIEAVYDAIEALGRPHLTPAELARKAGVSLAAASDALAAHAERGDLVHHSVAGADAVYHPPDLDAVADRERVIVFPDRHEVVVEDAAQYTRAQLSQFAHLVDTNRAGAAIYEIREEDVWQAPYDDLEELLATMRDVLGERATAMAEWVTGQWERARKFRLYTHEDGYTVLAAESDDLMGNVARQKLDDDYLRAPISDSESWVNEEYTAAIKRTLYDAGYPVRDERDLAEGEGLDVELFLELRDYQQNWVDRFTDQGAGVFVGPPGSGKTVAALGAMAAIGGETLILVPSRELASQWHEAIDRDTTLSADQIGEYHGGTKEIQPVTIATYQTAGMDRHRKLFDERRWGLIVFDECLGGDTVLETRDGRRTFEELDASMGLEEGWNRGVDLSVKTFAPDSGEYEWTSVRGVYKTKAPLRRIETNTGRTLEATPNHTHVVFDSETAELREQEGLSEGEYLVLPHKPRKKGQLNGDTGALEKAELIGWYIGDGHLNEYGDIKFSFARKADEQCDIIATLCQELGVDYSTSKNSRGDRTIRVPKWKEIIDWDGPAGKKSVTVSVPENAYQWSLERIGRLLRGLFDAEGSVDGKGRIQFNTVSPTLARDVELLLQQIGILTRKFSIPREAEEHNEVYRLTIPTFYNQIFTEHVGFRLQHKRKRLEKASGESPATGLPAGPILERIKHDVDLTNEQLADLAGLSRQTTGDVMRGRYQLGQRHLTELGEGLRGFSKERIENPDEARERHNVTYERLSKEIGKSLGTAHRAFQSNRTDVIEATESIIGDRKERASEWAETLDQLRHVEILEVTDIEEIGEEPVYDLETDAHTFLANGILTHNCHHIPSPIFRRSADLQGRHRLGLTATPTRESDDEEEIFTLVGPPIGTDWGALFDAGFVAEPEVEIRLVPWDSQAAADGYVDAVGHGRRQAAASNPAKIEEARFVLDSHPQAKALLFVEYLDQGEELAEALDVPFISGETPYARREKLFDEFRSGERDTLVVSRVGDEGIDLPSAELAIVASGLGGSRRQGAQRAGRTMRPVGDAMVYVLATRGTMEEDFVRQQMRHLAAKGIKVTESGAVAVDANGDERADEDEIEGEIEDELEDGEPVDDAGEHD